MWVHMSKRSNNIEILQIRSCQIKVFREPTQVSKGVNWKLAGGQICTSKYTWLVRLLHHNVQLQTLQMSRSRFCRLGLLAWRQMWTRVRDPIGTHRLAVQNISLNCSKQVLLGWTGCNNSFSTFPSQISGAKEIYLPGVCVYFSGWCHLSKCVVVIE